MEKRHLYPFCSESNVRSVPQAAFSQIAAVITQLDTRESRGQADRVDTSNVSRTKFEVEERFKRFSESIHRWSWRGEIKLIDGGRDE